VATCRTRSSAAWLSSGVSIATRILLNIEPHAAVVMGHADACRYLPPSSARP
jgi:hypothetical protein